MNIIEQGTQKEMKPSTLDVLKVGKRWYQVAVSGIPSECRIKDILSGDLNSLKFNEYKLINYWGTAVDYLEKIYNVRIPKDVREKIHWGPEQEQHPELRGQVTVFGEYQRRKRFGIF